MFLLPEVPVGRSLGYETERIHLVSLPHLCRCVEPRPQVRARGDRDIANQGRPVSDLATALLDLVRPQLEDMVEAAVEERLAVKVSPWMTTEEAAGYLRTTEAAVRQRAQRGTIPAHKDDAGRWLFHREELDRALGHPGGQLL